ncbi:MAG: peptidoglycan editing factor PgeF [Nitrospirae bacterium]|nr:peptidoglycan editing factor PgeF [Nitrospirota bacterium]
MDGLICPDIFNDQVKAFFTTKHLGVEIDKITSILSFKKENIFLPVQKHTDEVLVLKNGLEPEIADAVITQRKGILIGVQTADCVPVLLFDRKRLVVGAVHAGWRGTAAQIVKKTIESMNKLFNSFPEDIIIAIGPSIRWSCYEVGCEVKDAICKVTGEKTYYWKKNEKKYYLDLTSANMLQISSMGIPEKNIWISDECTYCNPNKYYSYRYSKSYNGSQGGFIGIL